MERKQNHTHHPLLIMVSLSIIDSEMYSHILSMLDFTKTYDRGA